MVSAVTQMLALITVLTLSYLSGMIAFTKADQKSMRPFHAGFWGAAAILIVAWPSILGIIGVVT